MRTSLSAERELFILHASEERDARFVQTYLVPSLGLPRHQLLLSSSLPPGRTFLDAIEHALATSRVTLLIISPAFLREAWSLFSTSALLLEDPHLEPVWRLTFDLSRPRALMLALVTTLVLTVRATDPGATPVPALSRPLADVQLRRAPRPLPATPRCPSSTHLADVQCAAPLLRSPASPLALLPPAPF